MAYFDLNTISPAELQQQLAKHQHSIVACLCAAWCDVCTAYRPEFEALATRYPEQLFLWIDVEDQAELVDDFDVENFPTLLIQQHRWVTFYGAMYPDVKQLDRLLRSQATQSLEQLQEATAYDQNNVNLVERINLLVKKSDE